MIDKIILNHSFLFAKLEYSLNSSNEDINNSKFKLILAQLLRESRFL